MRSLRKSISFGNWQMGFFFRKKETTLVEKTIIGFARLQTSPKRILPKTEKKPIMQNSLMKNYLN